MSGYAKLPLWWILARRENQIHKLYLINTFASSMLTKEGTSTGIKCKFQLPWTQISLMWRQESCCSTRGILSHKRSFENHLSYQTKMSPLPTQVINHGRNISTALQYNSLLLLYYYLLNTSLIAIINILIVYAKKWKNYIFKTCFLTHQIH